ncbi:MAG: YkgJ family cysteine cluster protein [Planctomycetaceae bacterium]|nr:YkgJ family cysteine cluster protein [Planctomycetaceae bacterium]
MSTNPLPIIESCDDCGACCRLTPIPPFADGETARRSVPDELLSPIRRRIAADQQFDKLPCVWFNAETLQCRHYELRPDACRQFEINSDLCRLSRWEFDLT